MEKGKRKWVRMHIYSACYIVNNIRVSMRIKKEARQVNLKRGNIGIANTHKKYRRQDRDPGWLGHIAAR